MMRRAAVAAAPGEGHGHRAAVASRTAPDETGFTELVDQAHGARGGEPDDLSELVDRRPVEELVQGHQCRRRR